jgi:galactokinase
MPIEDAASRIAARVAHPESASWYRAPGRVNLIGDHTDYNDGFVLPVAIDRDCVVAALPAEVVRVTSLDLGETVELPADGSVAVGSVERGWRRTVAAVVSELAEIGRPPVGMDAHVASDVPIGSGLSSSAAFEVACATALAGIAGWGVEPVALAKACRNAEELASGVPCGIMDQLIAVAGREGCALLVDCRSLHTRPVPLPDGLALLVVHSGQPRALADSAYAERRRACEGLASRLGLVALRDAVPTQVVGDPLGRHVVSENARVLDAARVLEAGDLTRFGELLSESHRSLRDDFGVSTPALDALVQALVEAGAIGARLTGAGFGGSVVAVCDVDSASAVADAATASYRGLTGFEPYALDCRAVDGAGSFEPPVG